MKSISSTGSAAMAASSSSGSSWRRTRRPNESRLPWAWEDGGRTRARTWDPLIKSQLLYQLSYASAPVGQRGHLGGEAADCNRRGGFAPRRPGEGRGPGAEEAREGALRGARSEERRVGKECRCRMS